MKMVSEEKFNELYDGLIKIPLTESKRNMWFLIFRIAVDRNDDDNSETIKLIEHKIETGLFLSGRIK